MKNKITFYWLLISLIGNISINAQTPKSEFQKTVDSINAIIKANKLAYYIAINQGDGHFRKISATQQGIISFTDSIPIPDAKPTEIIETKEKTKTVLVSDCCHKKKTRTLDLFSVKVWDIHFFFLYLKDEKNETFAQFLGFKKPDLEKLKEQFEKLTTICKNNN